jgi:hypothetical protein
MHQGLVEQLLVIIPDWGVPDELILRTVLAVLMPTLA